MLTLPIKKKWFDMIRNGVKTEEYREIKPYYEVRMKNTFGAILIESSNLFGQTEYELLQGEDVTEEIREDAIQEIAFKNGYGKDAPMVIAECSLKVGKGITEWGAEEGKQYFVLTIHGLRERRKI